MHSAPVSTVPERFVYLNGAYLRQQDATISIFDRGFLFGDSVYEVIPVYNGHPFRLEQHLQRLDYSLSAVRLKNCFDHEQWANIINRVIDLNGQGHQSLYLQVTRGVAATRDHAFPEGAPPTILVVSTATYPPSAQYIDQPKTLAAICIDDFRWTRCDIKSTSLLANVLLRQQAIEAQADEAILLRNGELTEGAASNIFMVKDGIVYTAPKSHYLLGGITRDLLIELMTQHHIECRETQVSENALRNADEIWLSSSSRELAPITRLDGKAVGTGQAGPLWKQVAILFFTYRQQLYKQLATSAS